MSITQENNQSTKEQFDSMKEKVAYTIFQNMFGQDNLVLNASIAKEIGIIPAAVIAILVNIDEIFYSFDSHGFQWTIKFIMKEKSCESLREKICYNLKISQNQLIKALKIIHKHPSLDLLMVEATNKHHKRNRRY